MKRITFLLVAVATLAGVVGFTATASRHTAQESAPIFVTEMPKGYRDWTLVSLLTLINLARRTVSDRSY